MGHASKTNAIERGDEILPRVARREPQAMNECIERFGGLVWGIARRYIPRQPDAEDVVQDVFRELWEKADRFDPRRASEKTFIGLIARRRSIDWLRKDSRQPILEPITDSIEFESHPAEPVERIEGDQLKSALAKLPERTQNLFRLHFEKGMTHPEIAEETGIALGTVKTSLRRGLIQMRAAMRPPNPYKVS